MALIPFACQFTKASGAQQIPAAGLSVTFTLVQVALSGGAMTTLVNAQAATEVTANTPGEYFYVYSGALDFTTYFYLAAFKTTDGTVAQTAIGAAYFDYPLSLTKDASGRVQVQAGTAAGQINASGGKVPATLATADVSGNLPVNVAAINGAAVKGTGVAGNEWGPA